MAREFFCAYHTYREALELLSDAEAGRLFKSLLKFSETGEVAELRGNEQYLYVLMKGQIVRDIKRYDEICETNRQNGRKRTVADGSGRKRTVADAPQEKEEEEGEGKGERKEKGEENNNSCADAHNAPAARERVEYSTVVNLFNKICASLPEVKMITDKRKKAIAARMKEINNDYTELQKIFEAVEASDFLTGRSDKWQASFDWIFKAANWQKIREGNYKNRGGVSNDGTIGNDSTDDPWAFFDDSAI